MNQLMPWDGEVVRMGWPWHGKIRQQNKDLAGYVTLPNGATRPAIAYYGKWPMNHTHLFDMGLQMGRPAGRGAGREVVGANDPSRRRQLRLSVVLRRRDDLGRGAALYRRRPIQGAPSLVV